jgi:hypothetical protein
MLKQAESSSEEYLNIGFVPHRKQCVSITKTNYLMVSRGTSLLILNPPKYPQWAKPKTFNVKAKGQSIYRFNLKTVSAFDGVIKRLPL